MSIDKSGKYWKGKTLDDLKQYIIGFAEYKPELIKQSVCECSNKIFNITHEPDEGFVKIKCSQCGKEKYIADCAEIEDEIDPEKLTCQCKSEDFEVCVGFSFIKEDEENIDIKWITVGARCIECGMLGSPADWKIDYSPSLHLINKI